jgi:hypothetical protein
MDYWPRTLFPALEVRWRLMHRTIQGGIPVELGPRVAGTTGGGLWVCEMSGIWLRTRDQIKTARALDALLDGGLTEIVVGGCESAFATWAAPTEPVPHSDGTPFDDGSFYAGASPTGTVAEDAALRATTLVLTLPDGATLTGGEALSIKHTVRGERRYIVTRVGEGGAVTIRPPLREAVTAGAEVDFATGACVMRLANADDFFSAIRLGRFGDLAPVFVEAF